MAVSGEGIWKEWRRNGVFVTLHWVEERSVVEAEGICSRRRRQTVFFSVLDHTPCCRIFYVIRPFCARLIQHHAHKFWVDGVMVTSYLRWLNDTMLTSTPHLVSLFISFSFLFWWGLFICICIAGPDDANYFFSLFFSSENIQFLNFLFNFSKVVSSKEIQLLCIRSKCTFLCTRSAACFEGGTFLTHRRLYMDGCIS
jgi:hypothetical protein